MKGDRMPTKRPEDQIMMPTDAFYQRPVEEAPGFEKRAPIKQRDNLVPSKDKFYERPAEDVGPIDKRKPIRQPENLRPEGKTFNNLATPSCTKQPLVMENISSTQANSTKGPLKRFRSLRKGRQ